MSEAIPAITGEVRSQRRHEFVGGRVYLQAGGSQRHDLLAGLLLTRFGGLDLDALYQALEQSATV